MLCLSSNFSKMITRKACCKLLQWLFSLKNCTKRQSFPRRTLAELSHAVPESFSLKELNFQKARFQKCSLSLLDANNAAIKEFASVLFFSFCYHRCHLELPTYYTLSLFPGLLSVAAEII